MSNNEKLETIRRNFIRMCVACKIDTAFMVFHFADNYHGTLIYSKDPDNPCKTVYTIGTTVNTVLKQLPGVIAINNNESLN